MLRLSKPQLGTLYVILSGLLYGFLGYFGSQVLDQGFSIPTTMFWRFVISGTFIAALLVVRKERIPSSMIEFWKVFFCGMAFYSLAPMIYFVASQYIGTGLAMVIFFVYPAVVILLNRLLYKTPITRSYYASISAILLGMALLVDVHEFTFDLMGIGLASLSALCYALYIIVSKKSTLPPLVSTFSVSLGCAATAFGLSLATHSFIVPTEALTWIYLLGFGIISTALPILLFLEGLKYISSEKASILSVLEPVVVVICGVLLLHETITALQAIGVIVILGGAVVELLNRNTPQAV